MRSQFDDGGGGPDVGEVIAEVTGAFRNNLKRLGPIVGLALLAAIVFYGFYQVQPGERGVVRRFGKEVTQTEPGLHFAWPVLERVDIVNVEKIHRIEVGFRGEDEQFVKDEALMLTGDENIVAVQLVVQYRISEPSKFLFRLRDAVNVLHTTSEVVLRTLVGRTSIDDVMTNRSLEPDTMDEVEAQLGEAKSAAGGEGAGGASAAGEGAGGAGEALGGAGTMAAAGAAPSPTPSAQPQGSAAVPTPPLPKKKKKKVVADYRAQLQGDMRQLLQHLMDSYDSGIEIREVKLQTVDAPDEVRDAFHAVTRAREEKEKLINEARGYQADKTPRARGEKEKMIREAEAYKAERVLRAKGDAARFESVYAEYTKAKDVTRKRLYLETMERVLGSIEDKTLIDQNVAKDAIKLLPLVGPAAAAGGAK